LLAEDYKNSKHQKPNSKQIPTRGASACAARDRNSKFKTGSIVAENLLSDRDVLVIGISNLDIIWNLVLGIWDFVILQNLGGVVLRKVFMEELL